MIKQNKITIIAKQNNKIMTRKQALEIIKSGKFFSVEFVKKDGSIRYLRGRAGVKKYTNGKGRKYNPNELGYITVLDMSINQYRLVDARSIIKVNHQSVR